MSFSDQIKAFADKAQDALEAKKARVSEEARRVLTKTLGKDASLVEAISLNADTGKFYSIIAPEYVIQKLKEANLVETRPVEPADSGGGR